MLPTNKLTTLIEHYRDGEHPAFIEQQFNYYEKLSLTEAINDAVFGRWCKANGEVCFNDHFWGVFQLKTKKKSDWIKHIYDGRDRLLEKQEELEACIDFLQIYNVVRACTEPIHGLGELFFYDVSLYLGACLGQYPTDAVFIQRGTKKGAVALFSDAITSNPLPYLPRNMFDNLCGAFRDLPAWQIENFLCIYHPDLKKITNL